MQPIPAKLATLAQQKNLHFLLAVESGSRAWGFASPDSDYDVRALYIRPSAHYLAIDEGKDTFEFIEDEWFDVGAWDIRKALRLLRKSNAVLLEWLRSPVVYAADSAFVRDLNTLAPQYAQAAPLLHHYRGIARNALGALGGAARRHPADDAHGTDGRLAARCRRRNQRPRRPQKRANGKLPPPPERLAHRAYQNARRRSRRAHRTRAARTCHRAARRALSHHLAAGVSMLTLANLHAENLILFEAISGSHAYGLATPQSDTDIKGVFYLPRRLYYGLDYLPQISDAGNDTTYYELGRFVELLLASNPTALELLAAPPDTIRQRAPLMDALRPAWFLSKACQQTFAGYALGQIKKARGLNKKINAPVAAKTPLDFCHILDGARALPLAAWLARSGCEQRRIGLVRLAHARDLYAIYYDADGSRGYRGIQRHPAATGLCTESVAPDSAPLAYLSYNADGYSAHCRAYAEYQQWARERNPARYASTQAHGQGYDAKNLMHTIRLLETARDLARDGTLRVRRDNRDELLAIKHGAFTYDALLTRAEALMTESAALFAASSLPDAVDKEAAIAALVAMREALYG